MYQGILKSLQQTVSIFWLAFFNVLISNVKNVTRFEAKVFNFKWRNVVLSRVTIPDRVVPHRN